MNQGLNFTIMHVEDVAASRDFYTKTMGFEIEAEQPGFVQFKQPGGRGASYALSQVDPAAPLERIELWWFVDDADATCADLEAKGAQIVSRPKDEPFGRAFSVKDSAGNTLYMLQLPRGN